MGMLLLWVVPLKGSSWIKVVFPLVIHSRKSVSWRDLLISVTTLSWVKVNAFKPVYMCAITAWRFPVWYFLSVTLSESRCIFTFSALRVLLNLFLCCLSTRLFLLYCLHCYIFLVIGLLHSNPICW